MSRRTLLLGLLALTVVCARPAASEFADVKSRGSLRVLCVLDAMRPEFFALDAERPGFDHEVLQGFARLHQVRLTPIPVEGWGLLIPSLLAGQGDLIAGRFTATAARREQIAFTSEVFPTRNVIFTRRPHHVVDNAAQLNQEKVGTIRGTSMADAIASAGVPEGNVDDGLPPGGFGDALKSGRVTAAVWGVESAIALQREDPDIQIGAFLGPPSSLAYGLRPEDAELLTALDDYIGNLRQTATWSRLVVKYFGTAAPEVLRRARGE